MNATTTTDFIQYIPLDKIIYNRYQPRQTMDAAELEKLAKSIEQNTMLQKPTARPQADGCYELAFGHRRFEAYKLLAAQDSAYSTMPLIIRELSDEQMFDLAWDENEERADLNPIDEGKAYETWMHEFGKTSKEAGLRFHTSEENIRAKIRLGALPEPVKEKVRKGELNETAARSALTITRILPQDEDAMSDYLKYVLEDGNKPEDALISAIRNGFRTKVIGNESNDRFSMKAKTFKYLPELTKQTAMQALDYENNEWVRNAFAGYQVSVSDAIQYFKTNVHYLAANANQPELLIEKLNHLIKPPACTACPMFALIDGTGYCSWGACFDRKEAAHEEAEIHRVSEATGIAIYTKEDGSGIELKRYEDKHQNAFNKKHKDLRLRRSRRSNGYSSWEGVPSDIAVIAVGDLFQTWKKADEQSKKDKGQQTEKVDYQKLRAISQIRDGQLSLFAWEVAAPAFVSLLDGVKQIDVLCRIDDEMSSDILDSTDEMQVNEKTLAKLSKPAAMALVRKSIVFAMLGSRIGWNDENKITNSKTPVATFAKHIQGLATTWGVKLPKDFIAQAATHDEAVKLAIAELDKKDGEE